MKQEVKAGQQDYTVLVFIPDSASTDGSGKTGLNAAALTVSYTRVETDNDVTVADATGSLSDLSALTDAHADWGLKEVSNTLCPGLYRLDIADAVFATGAWSACVYVMVTTSAASASPMEFVMVPEAPYNGVSLYSILGTALTETAGQIAAAFKKMFDVATPTGTVNSLPDAVPGAAGGVFIAGTNAATTVTTALTTTFTGNVTGSVGSVTGAVGSVTGAVGSVTAGVTLANGAHGGAAATLTLGGAGGMTGDVTGNVSGSVGSVTGAVGSVGANGITATSIAADAINAASVKADAVTKIQNGLATPTNITAGTITTVTNLTNAPTNGDLTAAMKASVNAEVVDTLATDTYTEPGQGAPGVNISLAAKINYLYKAWRNRKTQTATLKTIYADDATTADHKSTVADDATTYSETEWTTGA